MKKLNLTYNRTVHLQLKYAIKIENIKFHDVIIINEGTTRLQRSVPKKRYDEGPDLALLCDCQGLMAAIHFTGTCTVSCTVPGTLFPIFRIEGLFV